MSIEIRTQKPVGADYLNWPTGRRPNLLHNLETGTQLFGRAILDTLAAHVAVIKPDGTIIETNRAWKKFAIRNNISTPPDTLGVNYLDICLQSKTYHGRKVWQGILEVIDGKAVEYVHEYPCHSPLEKRWFHIRVTRLNPPDPLLLMVSHEDITRLKRANLELRQREMILERQKRKLTESNSALRVLLEQRDEDKKEIEKRVLSQIQNLVLPYLEELERYIRSDEERSLLESVKGNLQEISSPFARNMTSKLTQMTPMELRVADLVRQGFTNKEISEMICVSIRTVEFHRGNIRRKLGLSDQRENLRTVLMTLS